MFLQYSRKHFSKKTELLGKYCNYSIYPDLAQVKSVEISLNFCVISIRKAAEAASYISRNLGTPNRHICDWLQ